MEDEFQSVVCGENWWNSSRNLFASSPCSAVVNNSGCLNPSLVKTAKSISNDSTGSASDGGSSVVLQEAPKPQNMPTDSTFHMMADDWNQDLIHDSARSQQNYSHMLQAMNIPRQKISEEWTTDNFTADSSPNSFRQVYQNNLELTNSVPNTATSFPLNTTSYSYTSSLLHTLFDTADTQPLLENSATNFPSPPPNFSSPNLRPSFPKQQQIANNFQFINNAAFWNATAAASGDVRASFLPSSTPQLIPSALTKPKLNHQRFGSKNVNRKAAGAEAAARKDGNEPSLKHARIETPSPTFKVRKEKLGDRVTALQQLVSPFGKTDTASVLHEAIDYIKLLHDQVNVLSTPYLKNGPPPLQRQQDQEEPIKDLKSRGLCLVPISSTFPVATETTADFWTPTFGGSFR
ncbi:transcription factor bHLH112-like isoform X1 [Salvia divinorum]|uniref:Transcription factor bHLH112-like isoform X1 n=1 Tax=Salvia divinorum TaxID=28513 RepID=A0ABD1IG74_SALDI